MSINIDNNNFEQEVVQSKSLIFVECYADWCGPCKALKPLLLKLEESNPEMTLGLLDIDPNHELAQKLKITSIPKVVVFNNGEEVASLAGLQSKEKYQEIIDSFKETK